MHCPELGDYVGAESCFCFDSVVGESESGMSHRVDGKRGKGMTKAKAGRELPPPLPWLARTGNSPSSRMPWVLKRYCTEDGRLIITGEKAERHEYFEAHRSDGRLRLNLVPLNVVVCSGEPSVNESDEGIHENEEEEEMPRPRGGDGRCDDGGGGDRSAATLEDRSALITDACGGGGAGNKCSNSFLFGVAVTPVPPVHT